MTERTLNRKPISGDGSTVTRVGYCVMIREDQLPEWIDRCAELPLVLCRVARSARGVAIEKQDHPARRLTIARRPRSI